MNRELVIIFGSSGYIGSAIMRGLSSHENIVGIDRTRGDDATLQSDLDRPAWLEMVSHSLRSSDSVCIICAAGFFPKVSQRKNLTAKHFEADVRTIENLVSLKGVQPIRVLYLSTLPLSQPHSVSLNGALAAYFDARLLCESLLSKNASTLFSVTIIRLAKVIGGVPNCQLSSDQDSVAWLLSQLLNVHELELPDPGAVVPFTYLPDLVEWIMRWLSARGSSSQGILELGSPDVLSFSKMASIIKLKIGSACALKYRSEAGPLLLPPTGNHLSRSAEEIVELTSIDYQKAIHP